MAYMNGRAINGVRKSSTISRTDFENSNLTTAAFLGAKQRHWMCINGESPGVSGATSPTTNETIIVDLDNDDVDPSSQSVPEEHDALTDGSPLSQPFPPGLDRGRFPAQRRRRRRLISQPLGAKASDPLMQAPLVTQCPNADEEHSATASKEVNKDVVNHLPSPSPSIDTPQAYANVADSGTEHVESPSTYATSDSTLDRLLAEYGSIEELEKHLRTTRGEQAQSPMEATSSAERVYVSGGMATPSTSTHHTNVAEIMAPHHENTPSSSSLAKKGPLMDLPQPGRRIGSMPKQPLGMSAVTGQGERQSGINVHGEVGAPNTGETEIRRFRQEISQRIQFITHDLNRPGSNVEKPRLGLLRDACERNDLFYLCLHQLFCLDHHLRGKTFPLLQDVHRRGLGVISYLLVSNDNLSADAIDWFSKYPLPWDTLVKSHPFYQSVYGNVLRCLIRLSSHWDMLHTKCEQRGLPPIVDDLVTHFDAGGFTFQQVIFRALLRDIWKGLADTCFQRMEQIFAKNHDDVVQRSLPIQSAAARTVYNDSILGDYQRTIMCHYQHTLQDFNSNTRVPPLSSHAAPQNDERIRSRPANPNMPTSRSNSISMSGSQTQIGFTSSAPQRTPSRVISPSIQHAQGSPLQHYPMGNQAHPPSGSPPTSASAVTATTQTVPREYPIRHVLYSNVGQNSTLQLQQPTQTSPVARPNPNIYVQASADLSVPRQRHARRPPGQTAHKPSTQLVRASSNLRNSQPRPAVTALHQAPNRDPILTPEKSLREPGHDYHFFRYIKHVFISPQPFNSQKRHLKWGFNVEKHIADRLVKPTTYLKGRPPLQIYQPGSLFCRIRCVKVEDVGKLPSQSEWAVLDNIWPANAAVVMNGTPLNMRRKVHHGKDLPIDATSYIKEGHNEISTAIVRVPENSSQSFAIGAEFIEVIEEQMIRRSLPVLAFSEARQHILNRSVALNSDVDPDVEITRSETVVALTDPFSAQMFEVPVRGVSCRHNQCFDRDTFLATRRGKRFHEPGEPDGFRCPICGLDARPQSLVIDNFLVHVRDGLAKKGRLDAKGIVLTQDGWNIKEEEPPTGEQGDGSGRRRGPSPSEKDPDVIMIDDD